MKKLIFPLLAVLAMAACTPKPSTPNTATESAETTTAQPQTPAQPEPELQIDAPRFKILGQVMVKRSYCGGAAPSEELLQQYATPIPAQGMEVIIRRGSFNNTSGKPFAKVLTNEQGMFKFSVSPGEYCICIAEKESNANLPQDNENQEVDEACLATYMKTCDVTVRVADRDVSGLKIDLQQQCFVNSFSNCIQWNGPLPPSAPRGDGN